MTTYSIVRTSLRAMAHSGRLAVFCALTMGALAMPALAQIGGAGGVGGLPDAIVQSPGAFSPDELALIKKYVDDHKAGLGGDSSAISASRKAILRPLRDRAASAGFRVAYADLLVVPVLKDLAKSKDHESAINAARILGELGTKSSISELLPILKDERAAVRLVAALGVGRTFDTVRESSQPALSQSDVAKALGSIDTAFREEQDPEVADAIALGFDSVIKIVEDKIPSVRSDAARRLSGVMQARVKDPKATGFGRAFARASKSLLDAVINDNANAALSELALKEAGGTAGDLLGLVSRRVTADVPSGIELEELCQIVAHAEKLFSFSLKKLESGAQVPKLELDKSLGCGDAPAAPEKFRRDVGQLIAIDGLLTKPPFAFSPDRFK